MVVPSPSGPLLFIPQQATEPSSSKAQLCGCQPRSPWPSCRRRGWPSGRGVSDPWWSHLLIGQRHYIPNMYGIVINQAHVHFQPRSQRPSAEAGRQGRSVVVPSPSIDLIIPPTGDRAAVEDRTRIFRTRCYWNSVIDITVMTVVGHKLPASASRQAA